MNKATAEIKEAARVHGLDAIKLLAAIMNSPKKPDAIRMAAADNLLDRGFGRPAQPVGGEMAEPITVVIRRFGDDDPAEDGGGVRGSGANGGAEPQRFADTIITARA